MLLFLAAFFSTGWAAGQHGASTWAVVKQATVDSYLNRYRVMSETGLTSIVYYVSTKDRASLLALADQSPEILTVSETKFSNFYDVRINYSTRTQTVKALRSQQNIDAVITLPLICH